MPPSSGQTLLDLVAELIAAHVTPPAATLAHWARIGWCSYLGYISTVFLLALAGYSDAALIVWALIPIAALMTVILVVPGMALGALLWPALSETRVGAVLDRIRRRFVKGVMGGGWFAYSLGNDVSDIVRFQWTHPWLSILLCIFAVPAVMRELRNDEDWGLWGFGACVVSGVVNTLDFLQLLRAG